MAKPGKNGGNIYVLPARPYDAGEEHARNALGKKHQRGDEPLFLLDRFYRAVDATEPELVVQHVVVVAFGVIDALAAAGKSRAVDAFQRFVSHRQLS